MSESLPPDPVAAVRRFSRFYTRQLGLLDESLLDSGFSLTEARVLYELATSEPRTATDLSRDLAIDPGYLSRLLKSFQHRGLITRSVSRADARQTHITLNASGKAAFEPVDQASRRQVLAMLRHRTPAEIARLVHSMRTIEELIGHHAVAAVTFRRHRLGDLGWIAHRQAKLYAQEYGWDATFEILAAELLAAIARNFDPAREQSWIAEQGGAVVGSAFVVRASDTVAKLRLLYVEPTARGLGLGRRLVDQCIAFARDKAYRTLTLWTYDVLLPARRIYQQTGFTCVARERNHTFGQDLISETWELTL